MNESGFKWTKFHDEVKEKYLSIAPYLWWGDDLDVRFFLLKNLMKIKNKKILDIGCNIGITLSFLDRSNELYGIEIDDYCVNEAKELNPTTNVFQGTMESLPYEDESFESIWESLVNDLRSDDIKSSKYLYVEAKKRV